MTKRNSETQTAAEIEAEISRQIKMHTERRTQIVNKRAELYSRSTSQPPLPVIDADERAAREHAKTLLNGSAPDSLSLPPEITQDRILLREQRGIDIALKILNDKSVALRAAQAVAWSEQHREPWCALMREIVLGVARVNALERRASEMLRGCADPFAVHMPMANFVGGRSVMEIMSSNELTQAAIEQGIVSASEIRREIEKI